MFEWTMIVEYAGVALGAAVLYALCAAQPGLYKCEDGLHLTEEGYDACARKIASVLEKYL